METLLRYGMVAVFAALILAPLGLPIPEDVSLIVAGTLARTTEDWSFAEAWIIGYLGVTLGDCIVWTLGKNVGLQPTGWLGRLFGKKQITRITKFYRRFGDWTVLICRNFPGLRFPAFFFAGASGMRFRRFITLDGAGAIITTSIWISVGWWAGPRIQEILPTLEQIRWLLLGVGLTVGGLVVWRWFYPRPRGDDVEIEASLEGEEGDGGAPAGGARDGEIGGDAAKSGDAEGSGDRERAADGAGDDEAAGGEADGGAGEGLSGEE